VVTFTAEAANFDNVATVQPSLQSCVVRTFDANSTGGSAAQDSGFNFIVVGPA